MERVRASVADTSPRAGRGRGGKGGLALRCAWLAAGMFAAIVAGGCGSTPAASSGEQRYLLDDLEAQRKLPDAGWSQLREQLPQVPTMADTLPIEPVDQRMARFRFGIDPRSISVAPGGIVRYVLVSESDRGAVSQTYETLRCSSREWRIIAVARAGEGWQRSSQDGWSMLPPHGVQQVLRHSVFCSGGGAAGRDGADLVQRLRFWQNHTDGIVAGNTPS